MIESSLRGIHPHSRTVLTDAALLSSIERITRKSSFLGRSQPASPTPKEFLMTMLLPARPVRELPAGAPIGDDIVIDDTIVEGNVAAEDLSLAGLLGAGRAKLSSASLVARKGLRGLLTRRELA